MCGIAGFIAAQGECGAESLRSTAQSMGEALIHRGPDDSGVWIDAGPGIAFAHRRLAVLDLSPEGHQPMISAGGRYVIVYNGEIYNFRVLRQELEQLAYPFRGHSDTEVFLAAIETWGIERALLRSVGMYAFALWDRRERLLSLGRDRMGEKPLYYGWQGRSFLFASQPRALKRHADWRGDINRDALALYLRHNYIPAPYSIYSGIYKLLPGTFLQLAAGARPGVVPEPRAYWTAGQATNSDARPDIGRSPRESVQALDGLLRSSVREQMVADVPVGAFLSGGIDSSTVVALMQAESSRAVRTFSIGFREQGYNEAEHARRVADYLGTQHTELYLESEQALEVIPRLPALYDEPFSDASQIPTVLLSEMTRRQVTVALSGDGGDELFAGYNRYFWGTKIWRSIGWIPAPVRRRLAKGIVGVSPAHWDKLYAAFKPLVPAGARVSLPGDKLHKLARIIGLDNPRQMYRVLVSNWAEPEQLVLNGREPDTALTAGAAGSGLADLVEDMMRLDMAGYLPDDILVKVDRAAMGASLETRIPLLDHRVIEFALGVPMSMKIRDGHGKWILRQVLRRYLPETLIKGPKTGFAVPIDAWLRGPLRDWAEALLDGSRIRDDGFLNESPIRTIWQQHLAGNRNWQYALWNILMFQAWQETEHRAA